VAKKSRTPTPPRGVQAPSARHDPSQRRDPRRTRLVLIGAGGVAAVAAVVVVLVLVLGGGGLSDTLAAAGCTNQTFPSQGRNHVDVLPKGFHYNSFPPTSGPHNPQPAIWNIYEEPVRQVYLVHSLEHGGIVVQYGDQVPRETIDAIEQWYAGDRNGVIVAPLPALKDKIAIEAWTHLATCTSFDAKAYDAFRDAYRFQGPEKLPLENMVPGAA